MKPTIFFALKQYSLGILLAARTVKGICAVSLGKNSNDLIKTLKNSFAFATCIQKKCYLQEIFFHLDDYFEQQRSLPSLPLDVLKGTQFERRVWHTLTTVLPGETDSYSLFATRLGLTSNYRRAIALACSKNEIALFYPCHRLVYKNGDISGYRWGTQIKKALLAKEKGQSH